MFESAVGYTLSGMTPLFDFTFYADLLVIFHVEQKVSKARVGAAATKMKNLESLNFFNGNQFQFCALIALKYTANLMISINQRYVSS